MSRVFERMFEEAKAEGVSVGFADGRNIGYNAGLFDVARNMRKDGKSDSEIIRYTGLPLSALENL